MIIINPQTGRTVNDPWFDSISITDHPDVIKVCCNLSTNGENCILYKNPEDFQIIEIQPLDINTRQIYKLVYKDSFYKHVFGNLYLTREEITGTPLVNEVFKPVQNIYDMKDTYANIVDTIFKDYPYGKPLKIISVRKKNVKQPVDQLQALYNDLTPDDIDDTLYLTPDELDAAYDAGDVYTDDDGSYYEVDTERPVKIRLNNTIRPNRLRINRNNNVNNRWYDADGYYWPIKNIDNLFNINVPGYAMYTSDDKEYNTVITKNYNNIDIGNLNSKQIIDAIIKHCKVIITDVTLSTQVFGRKIVKKRMMLNDKNTRGYEIANIIPNYKCIKDSVQRDVVVIKGDINYKFCLSDVKIVFPFANSILKGIIPVKDKKLRSGCKAKIINDKSLKIAKGEIVTVIAIEGNEYANSDINYIKVVTVADKGGNRFKMWSNHLKVI